MDQRLGRSIDWLGWIRRSPKRYFGRRTEPFFGLYKAYEVVVDSIGLDGIQKLDVPTNACERFTRAANDPEISGVYSRRSKKYSDAPLHPMSEFEARQFIAYLLRTLGF